MASAVRHGFFFATDTSLSPTLSPRYFSILRMHRIMPSLPLSRQTPAESTFFGILDLASAVDIFLQGVLCAQFARYTNVNQHDSRSMKLWVAGLALLTTLRTLHTLAIRWIQDVTSFETPEAASNLWHTQWVPLVTQLSEAVIAFYVQLFFCHRLWILSHNVYIVVVAMILFVCALAATGVATHFYTDIPLSALWIATHLGVAMGGDLLQTGSIVFYLLRHSKTILRWGPTASMINSLLRLTIHARTLCTLVNFVTAIATVRAHAMNASGLSTPLMIAAMANTMLPKLYAIAAMLTLNSREDIRSAANALPTHFDFGTGVGGTLDPETPRHFRPGEVEMTGCLSSMSFSEVKTIHPRPSSV
ncbi:hypothetical protein K438DRAFT_1965941 [Mycena galopus ATCC 62051]|nr:hypothetical protein K438DRAFT_1965941 [Mycena galopus ATCC 62051]